MGSTASYIVAGSITAIGVLVAQFGCVVGSNFFDLRLMRDKMPDDRRLLAPVRDARLDDMRRSMRRWCWICAVVAVQILLVAIATLWEIWAKSKSGRAVVGFALIPVSLVVSFGQLALVAKKSDWYQKIVGLPGDKQRVG